MIAHIIWANDSITVFKIVFLSFKCKVDMQLPWVILMVTFGAFKFARHYYSRGQRCVNLRAAQILLSCLCFNIFVQYTHDFINILG